MHIARWDDFEIDGDRSIGDFRSSELSIFPNDGEWSKAFFKSTAIRNVSKLPAAESSQVLSDVIPHLSAPTSRLIATPHTRATANFNGIFCEHSYRNSHF
jgi:hypothetical protein